MLWCVSLPPDLASRALLSASHYHQAYGGGPLSKKAGDRLIDAGVTLVAVYGGTEFGASSSAFDYERDVRMNPAGKTREEWQWIQFPTDLVNIRWYSCHARLTSPARKTSQMARKAMRPRTFGSHTQPSWGFSGCEKSVPIQQETHVGAHLWVTGVLMFVRGREQPSVIIEQTPEYAVRAGDQGHLVNVRNTVRRQVEDAKAPAPAFARIFKEMILVADPARPFSRAAKGTIMGKQVLALYEADIDALYNVIAESRDAHGIVPPKSWAFSDVEIFLRKAMVHGVDHRSFVVSLSAAFLRNRIVGALRSSSDPCAVHAARAIQSNLIFAHPKLSSLARLQEIGSTAEDIETLVQKYAALLPRDPLEETQRSSGKGPIVLVTGMTGTLGAHLLAELLSNSQVEHVYALNRGSELHERQLAAFNAAQLPATVASKPKLTLLSRDLDREDFGLDDALVETLCATVTHVMYDAWRVHFNLALLSQIKSAVQLATTFATAKFFTSSVTIAQACSRTRSEPVPEVPVENPAVVVGSGYGSSKYVVEEVNEKLPNMLGTASKLWQRSSLMGGGRICGSRKGGAWSTKEWVPILVKSSIALGCFPSVPGVVSWVPMDIAARAATDIVLGDNDVDVVNIVHHRPVRFDEVLTAIVAELRIGLPFVSMERWVQELESKAHNPSVNDVEGIPAMKLLDFFQTLLQTLQGNDNADETEVYGIPFFESEKAREASTAVSWVPIDMAAKALVEFRTATAMPAVVHLVHPRPAPWSMLATNIASDISVPLVSYAEWLSKLGNMVQESHDESLAEVELLRDMRALRLLPFFKGLAPSTGGDALGFPRLSVERAKALSPTLSAGRPLGVDDVGRWLRHWRDVGMVPDSN
ncbi:uncharacterized protein LAESUDRAFT_717564 [Laetiporus sulphureus 93-53]|uniref:Thioester reductase (TE) domain-containing protein n=1 Tax=Laetiporus sulphureus 93-53 TaxID=1314785 RepID=A0A165BN05_9APHY|nr:uncharacterized protein LAESUDRAFT_717564 [Laetiporus sulphureus 93-53]KZT01337.1 hypothetical protein LAESUDRAFT_717564 [Laetiporus sulphureus 93-53]